MRALESLVLDFLLKYLVQYHRHSDETVTVSTTVNAHKLACSGGYYFFPDSFEAEYNYIFFPSKLSSEIRLEVAP